MAKRGSGRTSVHESEPALPSFMLYTIICFIYSFNVSWLVVPCIVIVTSNRILTYRPSQSLAIVGKISEQFLLRPPAPSTEPHQPILNHGLQEMRKGKRTPILSLHTTKRLWTNVNRTLNRRNFQKSPHQTHSLPPRARSKRALAKSAEGTPCYPDRALRRSRLGHRQ